MHQLRIERQRDDTLRHVFRHRQQAACISITCTCRLQVYGCWIVDTRSDPFLLQCITEIAAFPHLYDMHVIDMCCPWLNNRDCLDYPLQLLRVEPGMGLTNSIPSLQVPQFHAENGSLYFIHSSINSKHLVLIPYE